MRTIVGYGRAAPMGQAMARSQWNPTGLARAISLPTSTSAGRSHKAKNSIISAVFGAAQTRGTWRLSRIARTLCAELLHISSSITPPGVSVGTHSSSTANRTDLVERDAAVVSAGMHGGDGFMQSANPWQRRKERDSEGRGNHFRHRHSNSILVTWLPRGGRRIGSRGWGRVHPFGHA